MCFGVLGPLAVWADGGGPVHVAEAKVRALLADLLAHEGGPVSADRLVDDLWGAQAGRNPVGTLQARVSQLRRALGDPGLIVHGPAGYRLAAHDCDAARFRALVNRRSTDLLTRAAELERALALWRGPAYADFPDADFARAEAASLEEMRLAALEEQAEVRLELGERVDLAELVARHPLRERLRASHMLALYRGGRQSEALAAYESLRERLREELGLDPSPEVAGLHQAILRQDPGLAGTRAPDSNLPAPLSDLIGREAELAEVRELLATARLVTLTGPGGVGKTRLALEAARPLASHEGPAFPDGVWLVELAGAVNVAEVVAAVLGIRDDAAVALAPRLAGALAAKRMLLVLDNCEHLVTQAAELVSALLRAAPGLRVLATSQEPLGVTGENVRAVPPLPEPEAVRLFTARANVPPGETVATICRRLDGIPLALELAATRVRALGVQELADRLDDRFRLLNAGMRDAPARQRTLRAMIDWSWELLGEAERVVLRRLAVHADGCTLEAAEEVCAEAGVDVVDTLARLVDRSLVVRAPGPVRASEPGRGPGSRYRLLESVAAYCQERLAEAGELGLIRERHARYYTALAERADLRGPGQREWFVRLDAERANLRLALAGPEALRLVNALAWYWILRGRLREARRSLAMALAAHDAAAHGAASATALTPPTAEAAPASVWLAGIELLLGEPASPVRRGGLDRAGTALADWLLSHVRWAYGDRPAHEAAADRALAAYEELGDRWGVAAVLCLRAKLAVGRADLAAMERDGERGLALFRELGDEWGQVEAMDVLDRAAEIRGDYVKAARLREEALRLAEELGFEVSFRLAALGRIALLAGDYERADDLHERARRLAVEQSYKAAEENALLGLAMSARRQGRYEEAETYLRTVLDFLRRVRGTPGIAFVMAELGFVAEQRGDAEAALARQREGYEAAQATGDPRAIALALEGLAGAMSLPLSDRRAESAARMGGDSLGAARLIGAAAAIRRAVGAPLPSGERRDVDRIAGRLRVALGEDGFGRAFAAGERDPGDHLSGRRPSGERELGDNLPGTFRGRARVQPAAQRLHPLGHADQPEPTPQAGDSRI
ncbi:BTAD domain-containing putative transcriptional regulator [Nonomuraea basaltis]|uniref:BTAD domain-containing putative transcriptional regulator n=1 Tax=Nonomuraea basaltis TaxID=2495887 RepID=UPI001485D9A6|nr:BTAD domain-containing putative transcriptional regulator [Nonomuraea basaltis]